MNSQVEKGSVFVNQKYGGETRTFSWKIVVASVLVVVGVAFAIIYAYASGYFGGPVKLARNAETSELLSDSDSIEFDEKSEENLLFDSDSKELNEKSEERFFVVKNDRELDPETSVPGLKDLFPDSKELDGKAKERFFFVKNGNEWYSVSTGNSTPVKHDIEMSEIITLVFSTFCKYESKKLPIIASPTYISDNLGGRVFLYDYITGNYKIINFKKNLGNVEYVSLSLKEDKIVFTTFTGGETKFWIANIDGTDSKELEIITPSYSPQPQFALNDSVILYATINDKNENVIESFDLNLKTRDKKWFYKGKADILSFLVSPDGKKIVVHTASKLHIIDLTTNGGKNYWDNGKIKIYDLLKWSKNGTEIIYKDSGNNLWKLKLIENTYEQVKEVGTGKPIRLDLEL